MANVKMCGQVKWYDKAKGYGFIKIDGREKDIFFHAKQWNPVAGASLPVEGEMLSFTLIDGPKGPYATNLERGA